MVAINRWPMRCGRRELVTLNPAILAAAVFAALTGLALYQGVDAVRWRHRQRLWIAAVAILPLGAATAGAFWIGLQNPTVNFRRNIGFGHDWECNNLGTGGAKVCFRDLPLVLQPKPAALPSPGSDTN
jgi:hypothetical protein